MTPEKLWATLQLYDHALEARGYPSRQLTTEQYDECLSTLTLEDRHALGGHCRRMCEHCRVAFRAEFGAGPDTSAGRAALEKAMRWLGFVQGVCAALGAYSVNDLRAHSRES